MTNERKFALCAEIENLVLDEAEARNGYYLCLTKFWDCLSEEEVAQFNEIIAEELKHSDMLSKMVERFSKILPEK